MSVNEISKNNEGVSILPNKKGKNNFKMYNLDGICQSCSIFQENDLLFTPKTTDAIWYKKQPDGSFYIFLFEFKGDKLFKESKKCILIDVIDTLSQKNKFYNFEFNDEINRLNAVVNKYSDSLLNSLVLKPLETITISIPLIYEDYYAKNNHKNNVNYIDIVEFLRKSKIIYRVVSLPDNNDNRYRNRSRAILNSNMIPEACKQYAIEENDLNVAQSYQLNLKSFYKRYELAGIINHYDFIENVQFNNFTKNYLV